MGDTQPGPPTLAGSLSSLPDVIIAIFARRPNEQADEEDDFQCWMWKAVRLGYGD